MAGPSPGKPWTWAVSGLLPLFLGKVSIKHAPNPAAELGKTPMAKAQTYWRLSTPRAQSSGLGQERAWISLVKYGHMESSYPSLQTCTHWPTSVALACPTPILPFSGDNFYFLLGSHGYSVAMSGTAWGTGTDPRSSSRGEYNTQARPSDSQEWVQEQPHGLIGPTKKQLQDFGWNKWTY